jgi:hypothetical protein
MAKVIPKTEIMPDLKPKTIEIKRYMYLITSSWEDRDTKKNSYIARMWLYEDKKGESYFADVYFHGGSNPLPDPEVFCHPEAPNERFRLHYRISALSDIVDMLRNEKRVYLDLPHRHDEVRDQDDHAKSANIRTGLEFVGEGESP